MNTTPSTSGAVSDEERVERVRLLHQALTQAGMNRAEKMKKRASLEGQSPLSLDLEAQKNSIKSHPLWKVVELLLEKCEKATCTMNKKYFNMEDVQQLFETIGASGYQVDPNDEVYRLIVNTILVLKKSLAELERVHLLTDSFKEKYSAALKKTMSLDLLIGDGTDSDTESDTVAAELQERINMMCPTVTTVRSANGQTVTVPFNFPQHLIPSPRMESNNDFLKQLALSTLQEGPTESSDGILTSE